MRRYRGISISSLQKQIIWHLRVMGPTARSELAAALEQSNAAITRFSRELISLGLVEERDAIAREGKGRPMVPLQISGSGAYAAGATCHPGWVEVMLMDFAGNVLACDASPFESDDPAAFAEAVQAHLSACSAAVGLTERRFLGLGIAVPGYLVGPNERRAVVPWLARWSNVPLREYFAELFGMPVWIENDGSAAALGEYYQENLVRTVRSALIFFLGHGVGGGVIVDRDLFRGEYGNAGEIGRLFPAGPERPSGIDLLLTLQREGVEVHDLRELGPLIASHQPVFDQWMDRAAGQLATALRSGTAWLDPGAVVLSGALPTSLLVGLSERLESVFLSDPFSGPLPRIMPSMLGSSAVCAGAALCPIHALAAD